MSELPVVALVGVLLSGCATTSGREWLSSPIDERAQRSLVGPAEPVASPEARPRLSRTVTLGVSYASAPQRAGAAVPTSAAPVQVNVQTQVPAVVNHYGGYGYGYGYNYGYGYGSPAPVRSTAPAASSQQVGADWPAVRDYGPPAMR